MSPTATVVADVRTTVFVFVAIVALASRVVVVVSAFAVAARALVAPCFAMISARRFRLASISASSSSSAPNAVAEISSDASSSSSSVARVARHARTFASTSSSSSSFGAPSSARFRFARGVEDVVDGASRAPFAVIRVERRAAARACAASRRARDEGKGIEEECKSHRTEKAKKMKLN
tara:strand:- start:613 stop:1146 length:534 start_codon:yes stop_codon:yes gene_type:complete